MSNCEEAACSYSGNNRLGGGGVNGRVLVVGALLVAILASSLVAQLVVSLTDMRSCSLKSIAAVGVALSIVCLLVKGKLLEKYYCAYNTYNIVNRSGKLNSPYMILLDIMLILTLCLSSIMLML